MSTFDSTKIPLPDLIKQITEGKVQLPDFQRGWVWNDEHVRSLLVSIARSFPVGAVMLLETGGDVRFQMRPVENIELFDPSLEPERLILDGQQRLTSLTQVLALKTPVKTFNEKSNSIERFYYINIEAALDDRLEDAFVAVSTDKKLKGNFGRDVVLDLSTPEKECEAFYFPCNQILNSDEWEEALQKFYPSFFSKYMEFRKKLLNAFRSYQFPLIILGKATSKEAVCLVFEKVNTSGTPLSVFELVTASFAADGFNLRDDWYGSTQREVEGRKERIQKEPILRSVKPTDFLQAISLLHTLEKRKKDIKAGKQGQNITAVSAKNHSILSLPHSSYSKWADDVEEGFLLAAKFLRKECFFSIKDLPYRTQLVPLAAVLCKLKQRWLEPKIFEKLSQWFWCGVLGELYNGAVETRIANDLEELLQWIDGSGEEPRTIYEASFQQNRLMTLRSRLSAAYKGLNTLILRNGSRDFFLAATIQEIDREDDPIDIHHIFPKAWCEGKKIPSSRYDSILNKTPISSKTNRMIGGKEPSAYLKSIQSHSKVQIDDSAMNEILESHLIDATLLRKNDFQASMLARQKKLLKAISQAMGKTLSFDSEQSDENELALSPEEFDDSLW